MTINQITLKRQSIFGEKVKIMGEVNMMTKSICSEDNCQKLACSLFGKEWTVCVEHLKKHHPTLFLTEKDFVEETPKISDNSKFKKGTGCFTCEICGKNTRKTGQDSDTMCEPCEDRLMHENAHSDNSYPNDDCGDPNCPIKHYTKEQRWWLK